MKSTPLGYLFTFLAFSVFAIQDGLSKHLGETHSPVTGGDGALLGLRRLCIVSWLCVQAAVCGVAVNTKRPFMQILRGLLLFTQILVSIVAFTKVGLAQSQAIFAAGPIFVALLSMPILGEKVGWRRWTAILFGLVGVVIMLSPTGDGFNVYIWLPLICAIMGAIYGIATRLVSRDDQPSTSFLLSRDCRFHWFQPAWPPVLDALLDG